MKGRLVVILFTVVSSWAQAATPVDCWSHGKGVAIARTGVHCLASNVRSPSSVRENFSCPTDWLVGNVQQNRYGSIALASAKETCANILVDRAGIYQTTQGFENYLRGSDYRMGNGAGFISDCLRRAMPLGRSEEQIDAIGEWYSHTSRLRRALVGATRSLAEVDSLLGEPREFWLRRSQHCWNPHLKELIPFCQQQAKCAARPSRIEGLLREVQESLPLFLLIQAEKNNARANNCGQYLLANQTYLSHASSVEIDACLATTKNRLQDLQGLEQLLILRTPIFASADFMDNFSAGENPSAVKVGNSFRRELLKLRDGLEQRIGDFHFALRCLAGSEQDCGHDAVEAIVAQTPNLLALDEAAEPSVERRRHLNEIMGRMACLSEARSDVAQGQRIVRDFVVNSVVTAATVGVGTTVSGLLNAGKGVQGTLAAYRALAPAQRLGVAVRAGLVSYQSVRSSWDATEDAIVACSPYMQKIDANPPVDELGCAHQDAGVLAGQVLSAKVWDCLLSAGLVAMNAASSLAKFRSFPGKLGNLATRISTVENHILDWDRKLVTQAFKQLPVEMQLRGRAIVRLLSSKAGHMALAYLGGLSESEKKKALGIKKPLMRLIRLHLMNKLQAQSEVVESAPASQRILAELAMLIATSEGVEPNNDHELIAVAISQGLGLVE